MAKQKRSRFRSTVYATFALAPCVLPPFLLGRCQLDTSPRISKHPPVESDDSDSGETDRE